MKTRLRPVSTALLALMALFCASVTPAAAQNLLKNADFTRLKPGAAPAKPWQVGAATPGIEVAAAAPDGKGAGWLRLRDDSKDAPAALRQSVAPLTAGRFTAKISLAEKHAATLGIYLGVESASSPADRVIDLKTNARGVLQIGTAGEREASPITLEPGATVRLFVQWRPNAAGDNLDVDYGTLDERGQVATTQRLQKPVRPRAISTLRITTDKSAVGADFYVTDLRLTPL